MISGPEVLWLWNDALPPEALRRTVSGLRARGVRSVGVWPWSGLSVPLLSDAYLERLRLVIEAAAREGLSLWLADDLNWPSGSLGGRFLREHPECAQQALLCASRWVRGEQSQTVEWWGEGEHLLAALALDAGGGRYDLAKALETRGVLHEEQRNVALDDYRLTWEAEVWRAPLQVPAGEWFLTVVTQARLHPLLASSLGTPWAQPQTGALDVLSSSAMATFTGEALAPLLAAIGDHAGRTVQGILSCPPAPLLPHSVAVAPGWRLDVLPWLDDLPEVFEAQFGRPLVTHLPYALAPLHTSPAVTSPALERVLAVAAQRYDAACATVYRTWCQRHGLAWQSLDPQTLPQVPQSLAGERARALDPARTLAASLSPALAWPPGRTAIAPVVVPSLTLTEAAVASLRTTASTEATEAHVSASEQRGPAWTDTGVFADRWEWQPRSLNLHPVALWSEWEHDGRGGHEDRFTCRAIVPVEYVPLDAALLFDTEVVQSVTLNGLELPLVEASAPRKSTLELAEWSGATHRLLPLFGPATLRRGPNELEMVARLPHDERIRLGNQSVPGPVNLVGAFALRPLAPQTGVSRLPGSRALPGAFALLPFAPETAAAVAPDAGASGVPGAPGASIGTVAVVNGQWAIARPHETQPLAPWRAFGYPWYAGSAVYAQSFRAPALAPHARLVVEAHGAAVTAWLNGRPLGIRLLPFNAPAPPPNAAGTPNTPDTTESSATTPASPPHQAIWQLAEALLPGLNRLEVVCQSELGARLSPEVPVGVTVIRVETRV